jgi:steroid delta-isomerase-like uncharacterized protein
MDAATFERYPLAPPPATALSRRAALGRLGGGLAAALALAAGGRRVAAQEAGPAATPPGLPPLLAEWEAAMATHDPDRILALYAADAVWEEVALNLVARGHEEIRAHLERLFVATPDIAFDLAGGFAAGDRVAAEWTVTGTSTGDFPGLPPATGQRFSFRGASIFELADGQIARYTEYWDAYAFLVQLGALPAPEAEASPAP